MNLYPLTFTPIFKERIWGGEKLEKELHKPIHQPLIGESWEVSTVKGDISVIDNGALKGTSLQTLIEQAPEALLGRAVYKRFGTDFPLLIKFIDAAQDLSIQVHPDDALAKARHNSFGKTEMWYIMEADPNASIIIGFNRNVSKEEYQSHLENKTLSQLLNYEKVSHGDMFFIPAGKIHAIGAGVLLAEIQQTSDITYRVYDFDRKDDAGNLRELHLEQSIDVLTIGKPANSRPVTIQADSLTSTLLVANDFFAVYKWDIAGSVNFKKTADYSLVSVLEGLGELEVDGAVYALEKGEHFILPSDVTEWTLSGDLQLIVSHP